MMRKGTLIILKKVDESTGFKTKSILCVPLSIKEKTIGCIELINKHDDTIFDDEDITAATIMSNLAAVSIRNAEVHEKLQTTNLALQHNSHQVIRSLEKIKRYKGFSNPSTN